MSRALRLGLVAERLAAERLARGLWHGDEPGPVHTLGDRVALLAAADAPRLEPAAVEAAARELGGLSAAEEATLERAWRYYLARQEITC